MRRASFRILRLQVGRHAWSQLILEVSLWFSLAMERKIA